MGRAYIVGDIHGCVQELEVLVAGLPLQTDDRLVFLGDYIDRGPGSREVVDLLLRLRAEQTCQLTFLKGNHEDMFLDYLGKNGHFGEGFLDNGGHMTLRSYRIPYGVSGREAAESLPPEHLQFFQELVDDGLVWRLQGHYGRTAARLIEAGLVRPGRKDR